MQFSIEEQDAAVVESDLLIAWVQTEGENPQIDAIAVAADLPLQTMMESEGFKGKPAETFLVRGTKLPSARLLLVGVGSVDDQRSGSVRKAAVTVSRTANDVRAATIAVTDLDGHSQEIVEGLLLGEYKFDEYLASDEEDFGGVQNAKLLFSDSSQVETGEIMANAINHARDLVNMAPNDLFPGSLADAAKDTAHFGNLECKIFDEKELEEKGMNLILAVGKGSIHPPRLIHLTYKPEGDVQHVIGFVGKGVTFDTGGYNLKPGASMLNMHCDMAGSAAVLGAAKAIAELRPPNVEVHFIVPTAENAIANNAFKPQDIFRGYGGKTVEIHNTDAEGRLILADALAYAQEQGVEKIVDLATLTGACVVALGDYTAGLFTNDDELAKSLLAASELSGEHFWRMPLTEKLDKHLDTPMADMKNVGPRWGGAITAALFLKRWVDIEGWAHMDIAGPAWADADDDLSTKGGTGFAVATLVRYVQHLSDN